MEIPAWVGQALTLSLNLSYQQQLGLMFLLGTFAVATWSDLKRLSAQREFVEIWLLFLAGMIAFEIYDMQTRETPWQVFAIKWGLICMASLVSLERLPLPVRLFRLARADVAAMAAAASLLTPMLIVVYFGLAKALSMLIGPILRRGQYYPFMPVVSLATLGILAMALNWRSFHSP